ncbi:MAG: sigma-70 family RNA polymerase sigma factor, partial [Verrucomicrobiota bacterium]
MSSQNSPINRDQPSEGIFPSTHWSIIVRIRRDDEAQAGDAREAVDELCSTYWKPVYLYVRWRGLGREDAEDVTQEVFSSLLESGRFEEVDPEFGRLRSFLKAVAKRHVSEFFRFHGRKKRGGDKVRIQLDPEELEAALSAEGEVAEPEAAFDRKWAMQVLDSAAAGLRAKYADRGRDEWFEALYPEITPNAGSQRYQDLAEQLNTSLSSIKVGVHRMRQQY